MRIRNRGGAITPAEGCLFAAMALFAVLLVAMMYIGFMRFRQPPAGPPGAPNAPRPSAIEYRPPVRSYGRFPVVQLPTHERAGHASRNGSRA